MPIKTSIHSDAWGPVSYTVQSPNPSLASSGSIRSGVSLNTTNSVDLGGSLTGWKDRIRQGVSATTGLSGLKRSSSVSNFCWIRHTDVHQATGDVRTTTITGPLGYVPGAASYAAPDSTLLDSANSEAMQYFVSKAIEAQRSIQALVTLGELGQTIRMIKRPLSSLFQQQYRYLDRVKRRARRETTKRKKNEVIADTWLEYSFGWQPLVNDIHGGMEALAATVHSAPLSKRITGVARRDKTQPAQHDIRVWPSGANRIEWRASAVDIDETMVKYTGAVRVQSLDTPIESSKFGLRMRDIVPSLWELIPYSFMVDYFTNAGEIINALAFHSADLMWCEKGTMRARRRVHTPGIAKPLPINGWKVQNFEVDLGRTSVITEKRVTREKYADGFIPRLTFEIPGASSKKWLNIAALTLASKQASRYAAGPTP